MQPIATYRDARGRLRLLSGQAGYTQSQLAGFLSPEAARTLRRFYKGGAGSHPLPIRTRPGVHRDGRGLFYWRRYAAGEHQCPRDFGLPYGCQECDRDTSSWGAPNCFDCGEPAVQEGRCPDCDAHPDDGYCDKHFEEQAAYWVGYFKVYGPHRGEGHSSRCDTWLDGECNCPKGA